MEGGDGGAVLKTAQRMMAERGFEVSKIGGGEVRGTRTHSLFTGKKTNDMLALVSELIIRASSGHLSAEAEFGTLRKLIIFLTVLVVAIESVTLFVGLVVLQEMEMMVVRISLLTAVPWVFLGPGMLFMFRRQSFREIETLLNNAATIGAED